MLILKGCSLSPNSETGSTPLHLAAKKSDVKFVKLFLDNGINAKTQNYRGRTALHKACTGSSLRIVRLLINKGCNINKQDNNGKTPLFFACNKGNVMFVRYLLQRSRKVNAVDLHGNSPIFDAIGSIGCSTELVTLLLNAGAEINHKNDQGETPLLIAINCLSPFIKLDLHSHEVRISIAKLLIDAGSDVNVTDYNGKTFLHIAIIENHEDLVRLLLNAGCNVDVADDLGNSPLFYACGYGKMALAKLLVEAGADLHRQNWLHCEIYNSRQSTREILDYLKQKSQEFPRLGDMCRTTIRKHLGRRLEMVLFELQLSLNLSNYIRLIETNYR